MLDEIYTDLKSRMDKTMASLDKEFQKIRTGRATPAILDGLSANYYGTMTPLSQMASISVPEPRLLVLQPWDASALGEIEKVILKSDLGLTPQNDGKLIRLKIPVLSQERRKELAKLVGKGAEEAKIALRSLRREANDLLKELKTSKEISEDQQKKGETEVQKITNDYVAKADAAAAAKEKEIMEF
ncbi:MAG: ribosome recycling factor [Deltaproteobacteria bacterium]|jgi:ribosome recycling factor|nr:ribosome recycling factor [Deltaproteobacteria bacterium]